jgi:hypothetical protein
MGEAFPADAAAVTSTQYWLGLHRVTDNALEVMMLRLIRCSWLTPKLSQDCKKALIIIRTNTVESSIGSALR